MDLFFGNVMQGTRAKLTISVYLKIELDISEFSVETQRVPASTSTLQIPSSNTPIAPNEDINLQKNVSSSQAQVS